MLAAAMPMVRAKRGSRVLEGLGGWLGRGVGWGLDGIWMGFGWDLV